MKQRFLMAIAFLAIAACTTTATEPPPTDAAADAIAPIGDATGDAIEAEGLVAQVDAATGGLGVDIEDPDELICIKERVTGSRIKKKVCLTRKDRDRIGEVNRENYANQRIKAAKSSPPQ